MLESLLHLAAKHQRISNPLHHRTIATSTSNHHVAIAEDAPQEALLDGYRLNLAQPDLSGVTHDDARLANHTLAGNAHLGRPDLQVGIQHQCGGHRQEHDAEPEQQRGKNEETDEEFLQKRNLSLENPAFSTTGSLNAQLLNLPGVTDAFVYENDTDDFGPPSNPDWMLDAHSIWAIVEGGTIDDIMQASLLKKTGGAGMKGDIEADIPETLTRPDGSTFVIVHTRRFDRPTYEPVYIRLTATRKDPLVPADVALIKQKIATYKFYIGTPLQAGFLYCYAYEAGDDFILTDIEISKDGITYTDGKLGPFPGGKFTIDVANIAITEVIP
jgi:hypothetical protein